VELELTVANVGDRHGSEVVQVYGSQNSPDLVRANSELLAFDRVSLDAGEEATVELSLPASDLGYYRPGDGHVVEADSYELTVGDHTASVAVDGTYL
jgi:beta-glucosidase